jgi:hypothetical protein
VRGDDCLDVDLRYQRKIRDGELIVDFRAAVSRDNHISILRECGPTQNRDQEQKKCDWQSQLKEFRQLSLLIGLACARGA